MNIICPPANCKYVSEKENSNVEFINSPSIDTAANALLYSVMDPKIYYYEQIVTRLSKLCRICGDPVQNGVNIFGNHSSGSSIKEKIDIHMPIKIGLEDMMPQRLCMDCYHKLEAVHKLVVTSLKTDMRFRRFLNIDINASYDLKFSKIVQECSEEVRQELFSRDKTLTPSVPLKKVQQSNDILQENTLQSLSETELPNYLSDLLQDIVKENGSINCLNCKDNFKNSETFENHKVGCGFEDQSVNNDKHIKSIDSQITEKAKSTDDESTIKRRCGHCKVEYFTRKDLQIHMNKAHEGKNLYMCGTCDKVYQKWSGLDVHEATHRTDTPYLCDLCGKSFKHSNNLRGHKRTHLDENKKKRHECEICHKRFRSRFHLKEHINSHNENRPYSCEDCGKSFSKRVQLRQHKLSHGSNKFVCSICGVSFNRRGNMMAHMKTHNKGDAAYTCSVCEAKCKTMSELKIHRKQHTEADIAESIKKKMINKPTWQCKVCLRLFLKQTLLLSHERTHAPDKSEYNEKLASKTLLICHQKAVHSKEKSHVCQYCDSSFVFKEARLIHERGHTGERPYVCEICHTRYKCSSHLSQHMKSHSDVWPYICQYCNKGFTRKGTLNVHERMHTGVKPYSCDRCGKSFAQKSDMIKHMKIHEKKLLFKCNQCDKSFETKAALLKHQLEHQELSVVHSYVMVPQLLDSYTLNIVHSDQLHVISSTQ